MVISLSNDSAMSSNYHNEKTVRLKSGVTFWDQFVRYTELKNGELYKNFQNFKPLTL